jgi:hypothetical protein
VISSTRAVLALLADLPHHLKHYFAGRATTTANPFGAYKFLRTVSAAVLVCFTSVTFSPAMAAIRADSAERERRAAAQSKRGSIYSIWRNKSSLAPLILRNASDGKRDGAIERVLLGMENSLIKCGNCWPIAALPGRAPISAGLALLLDLL